MPLSPGDVVVDRYRVEDLLAHGGMSAVYKAWDLRLQAFCALKEMIPYPGMNDKALAQLREQFLQEAQVLRDLVHPNMPRVFDHFEWEGNAYLVMDYVQGQALDGIIEEQGKIPVDILLGWARELFDALYYCHQKGVLHRDVKPQNVIITPKGTVSLVDFGLAKLTNIEDRQTRTVMRGLGTPEYAPPEQYDAETGSTDERSDIYGLGATFYHALTGKPPPTATQRIVDPSLLKPVAFYTTDVAEHIGDAIVRSLSLQPSQRFRTVPEMAEAIMGTPVEKPTSKPLGSGARPRGDPVATVVLTNLRRIPRQRMWAGAAGGVIVLFVLFFSLQGRLSLGATATSTPTPTPTAAPATATSTASPSPTASVAPTATPTATGTATATGTPTDTPTATDTPTRTPSRTPQPTRTRTATPTVTRTGTVTPTPTATRVIPTFTPTPTDTPTRTPPPPPPPPSRTPTRTPTPPTPTPTWTLSPTPITPSPTITRAPPGPPTATPTP